MKQRILVAATSVVLAALILLFVPLSPKENPQATLPSQPSLPTIPTTQTPTDPTTPPPVPGVVRIYTCDAKHLAIYEAMVAEYIQRTGNEVILLSPGESDCQSALQALMESEDPPTVLCLHSQEHLTYWQDRLLDLRDTQFGQSVCSDDLGWRINGQLLAVPMGLEGFGLLMNAQLLSVMGTRNEITDLTILATTAQILRDNSIKAFADVELQGVAGLYLMQNSNPASIRTFLDLYRNHKASGSTGLEQFVKSKAVFYLGTTGSYSLFAREQDRTLELRDLDIVPTCTAQGIQYICQTAWAVNGSARQEDIAATLQFLSWMVTAGEQAAPIDQLQMLMPFQGAGWYSNQLENKLLGYMRKEKATLMWMPDAKAGMLLLEAVVTYLAEPTDTNWAAVAALLPRE